MGPGGVGADLWDVLGHAREHVRRPAAQGVHVLKELALRQGPGREGGREGARAGRRGGERERILKDPPAAQRRTWQVLSV